MPAKPIQTLDSVQFSVSEHYGFTGFPKGDWLSGTNPVLLPAVHTFRALAEEDFDHFSRTELKDRSNLTRYLPGVHQEAFTNFYEVSREWTLAFSLRWFTEFGEIAKGNRDFVSGDPIWWAHAQTHALLCQALAVPERSTGFPFWHIRGWIQYFCDGDQPTGALDTADLETADGFLRFTTRSDWRAPMWLWAWARKYYGSDAAPWKSLKTEADSMEQLGAQETEDLLTKITSHFWEHIDHRLSEHAARVSVGNVESGISFPAAESTQPSSSTAQRSPEAHDKSVSTAGHLSSQPIQGTKASQKFPARQTDTLVFVRVKDGFIVQSGFSDAALLNTYEQMLSILGQVRAFVLARGSENSVETLQHNFGSTALGKVATSKNWEWWIGDFSKGTTYKAATLVFLEHATGTDRMTLKPRLSRARTARRKAKQSQIGS